MKNKLEVNRRVSVTKSSTVPQIVPEIFMGPIMEFLVPDAEAAKEELLKAGCKIVQWEGKGRNCYMRDPFGFVLNLYEEPEAFLK